MNQKIVSIIIGFSVVAVVFGLLIFLQFKGAHTSLVKDKFPVIASELLDTSKIKSLLGGLQKNGNVPATVDSGDKGRDNPFDWY